ncbi:tetratricopeptide repeat protein [Pseudoduganella sp. FT25W]|uniref:Tetratricopeptide repeat protein n=1 Tax=Duganella alba TaxID=2666081 RepID=A0A6L5QA65_9BURK|nr:tetratricopeptide repeat protein [Duganella alba]MRX06428.1 tetratricopeptide repeat protein [Duganella alba]MRX14822.1 tetratricopeptide repeat protein [Duganella alba]
MKSRAIALLFACASAAAADDCPDYIKHDPGGDYVNADDRKGLSVVENYHFTPNVERLVRGASGSLGADIGYTLEHFPNHHRALAAMSRLALRDRNRKPPGAHYTVECYFERALRYRPQDARVHSLYGSYLLAIGQTDAALEKLEESARLEPANATAHYNLGLLYVKKKDYDKARASAQKAYAMGFPLPGLKNKLAAAGEWRE